MTGETGEYILGTDDVELQRLAFQHQVWAEHCQRLWRAGGVRAGHRVLDLGSGPGLATLDLAQVVGASGHVIARDQSGRFLQWLAATAARRGLRQIETSVGPAEELTLPEASLDAVYSRWLFCWLPDAEPALARAVRALRPGGVLLLHEYLHWGTNALVPPGREHARAVSGCLASFATTGNIDFGATVPQIAGRHGLEVESFEPIARLGGVGSPEWRWVIGFFREYLPKLVARGLLDGSDLEAWRRDIAAREAAGASWLVTPMMSAAVLRKR